MRLNLGRSEGVVVEGHVRHAGVGAEILQVAALAENLIGAGHGDIAIESLRRVSRSRDSGGIPDLRVDIKQYVGSIVGHGEVIPRAGSRNGIGWISSGVPVSSV